MKLSLLILFAILHLLVWILFAITIYDPRRIQLWKAFPCLTRSQAQALWFRIVKIFHVVTLGVILAICGGREPTKNRTSVLIIGATVFYWTLMLIHKLMEERAQFAKERRDRVRVREKSD